MNLNTVRVYVHDLARCRDFYQRALGLDLRLDGSARGYCLFDAGNTELILEQVARNAPAAEQARVGRHTGLSFQVADLARTGQRLAERGAPLLAPPQRQFWGGLVALVRDPDGNELQIVQRPAG